jgi:hypothetical protein
VPDLVPILNVILAVGLLVALALGAARLLSRSWRAGRLPKPPADPEAVLHAAHESIDEIELDRVRSMLQRR